MGQVELALMDAFHLTHTSDKPLSVGHMDQSPIYTFLKDHIKIIHHIQGLGIDAN